MIFKLNIVKECCSDAIKKIWLLRKSNVSKKCIAMNIAQAIATEAFEKTFFVSQSKIILRSEKGDWKNRPGKNLKMLQDAILKLFIQANIWHYSRSKILADKVKTSST